MGLSPPNGHVSRCAVFQVQGTHVKYSKQRTRNTQDRFAVFFF